jgi:hypothetical protein
MLSLHTVQTTEGAVTITSGLPPVTEPYVETEGAATAIRVGRLEILIDPQERAQPATAIEG